MLLSHFTDLLSHFTDFVRQVCILIVYAVFIGISDFANKKIIYLKEPLSHFTDGL